MPIADFFLLPGDTPQHETVMQPGDLITHVILPPPRAGARSHYLKLRDRASYEFALASAAVVLAVDNGDDQPCPRGDGRCRHPPWRSHSRRSRRCSANRPTPTISPPRPVPPCAMRRPQSENGFKIELARRCVASALTTVAAA